MPANALVAARANVTAGFAKDVDAVNQYAEVMYAPTANGVAPGRRRESCDAVKTGFPNVACAAPTPTNAPATCAGIAGQAAPGQRPCHHVPQRLTNGLK